MRVLVRLCALEYIFERHGQAKCGNEGDVATVGWLPSEVECRPAIATAVTACVSCEHSCTGLLHARCRWVWRVVCSYYIGGGGRCGLARWCAQRTTTSGCACQASRNPSLTLQFDRRRSTRTGALHDGMATEGADDRLASAAMREEERGKTWVKTSRQSTGLCARPVRTVHYR